MKPLLYALPGQEALGRELAANLDAELGELALRHFPDGESYVRLITPPTHRDVVVLASLDRPDPKLLPLLLVLETAHELGAQRTGLVAPYLCYLRQDRRFHDGEAVSARIVPRLLARSTDWLVTVDPHLHRIGRLADAFEAPCRVVHAAGPVAAWIAANVPRPLLVGPDEESGQWVRDVADRAGAPSIVLRKTRRGDRDVEVSVPDVDRWRDHTPVLVDDIVSTGRTMIETLGHLGRARLPPAVCIAVHALFADDALDALHGAGATDVVSCDTIAHPTNRIALAPLLADAARALMRMET